MTNTNHNLSEGIDWVGAVDWTIRDFHSYDTQQGTTYNAYLVRDQQTALIDTVKAPLAEQLLRQVSTVVDPAQVDYIVCNHAELDHAGSLPEVLAAMPQATLLCNRKCAAALAEHFDTSAWRIRIIANGERISLGQRSLHFIDTPMVHWPESMFTYLPEEKLLFSMDAFGQHYASSARFDDQADLPTVIREAKSYYANIIMPYGKAVLAALERLKGLTINTLAPSHGVIWRSQAAEIIAEYRNWANNRTVPKVLVLYDTMWQSTAAMAEAIIEGANQPGITTKLIHVRRSSLTEIAAETLDAAALAIGSPTLNRVMMPAVAAVLAYFDGLRPENKTAVAFGSYGWGRGGPESVDKALRNLEWELIREPIVARYRPTPAVLTECRQAGLLLAEKALAADRTT